jgi:hypothetical protein
MNRMCNESIRYGAARSDTASTVIILCLRITVLEPDGQNPEDLSVNGLRIFLHFGSGVLSPCSTIIVLGYECLLIAGLHWSPSNDQDMKPGF